MKKIIAPALLVAFAALLSASIRAEMIEQVLVKVNGDIVTKTELEQRLTTAVRQGLNGRDPASLTPEERNKLVANATPEVLVGTVDELLLLQRGRELGLKLGDEQFKPGGRTTSARSRDSRTKRNSRRRSSRKT